MQNHNPIPGLAVVALLIAVGIGILFWLFQTGDSVDIQQPDRPVLHNSDQQPVPKPRPDITLPPDHSQSGNGTETVKPVIPKPPGPPKQPPAPSPPVVKPPLQPLPRLTVAGERDEALKNLIGITKDVIARRDAQQLFMLMLEWKAPEHKLKAEMKKILLDTGEDKQFRTLILKMLGEMKIEENRNLYKELCSHEHSPIRSNALIALDTLGGDDIKPYLENAKDDSDPSVRQWAEKILNK